LGEHLQILIDRGAITFRGFVTRDELDAAYAATDVILMPSRYESFGLVAIEAMAHGRPVLALAEGGLAEVVIDGQTGFTARLDDDAPQIMAKNLVALYADPQRLFEMSQSARALVEKNYSLQAMARQVETAFKERLDNR
jgi:glycosyltransferase involved in cell wall biosynthesis